MPTVCPKCDVALLILRFQDIEVDFCERCQGLWLDSEELESLLPCNGPAAGDPFWEFQQQKGTVPDGPHHLCPRCDVPLHEISVACTGRPALSLDKCPHGHGLWFDANELNELLAAFPAGCKAGNAIARLNDIFGMKPKTEGGNCI